MFLSVHEKMKNVAKAIDIIVAMLQAKHLQVRKLLTIVGFYFPSYIF